LNSVSLFSRRVRHVSYFSESLFFFLLTRVYIYRSYIMNYVTTEHSMKGKHHNTSPHHHDSLGYPYTGSRRSNHNDRVARDQVSVFLFFPYLLVSIAYFILYLDYVRTYTTNMMATLAHPKTTTFSPRHAITTPPDVWGLRHVSALLFSFLSRGEFFLLLYY
jgi:hypothetical protein